MFQSNQPNTIDLLTEDIHSKISNISADEIFLERLWKSETRHSLEDIVNLLKSLMNIQKKIQEAIHSIQNLSIIAASSRLHYRLGPMSIPLPWNNFNKKRLLNLYLAELENTLLKLLQFHDVLLNAPSRDSSNDTSRINSRRESSDIINHNSQSEEWASYESIRNSFGKTRLLAEDNQDSISILRCLIHWDYENGKTVGACDYSQDVITQFKSKLIERHSHQLSRSEWESIPINYNSTSLLTQAGKHSNKDYGDFINCYCLAFFVLVFIIIVLFITVCTLLVMHY